MNGDIPPASVLSAVGAELNASLPGLSRGAWLLTRRDGSEVVASLATETGVTATAAAAELEVGPAIVGYVDGWLITQRVVGHHLTPVELRRPPVLRDLGRLLARWHCAPVELKVARLALARQQYALRAGERLTPGLRRLIDWADEAEPTLTAQEVASVPAHLDVVANVLITPLGLRLIDFEYAAAVGPARELGQVIWEAELSESSASSLVNAYLHATSRTDLLGSDDLVAASATWSVVAGVTWTVWALSRPGPEMAQYSRRSLERLRAHWAWPNGLPVDENS